LCLYIGTRLTRNSHTLCSVPLKHVCLLGTGAELANVMNEAALEAVRRNGSVVNTADIYNAMDRILQVTPPADHFFT